MLINYSELKLKCGSFMANDVSILIGDYSTVTGRRNCATSSSNEVFQVCTVLSVVCNNIFCNVAVMKLTY